MVFCNTQMSPSTDATSSNKPTGHLDNEPEQIERLRAYFSKLDGTPDAFDNVHPMVEEIFHPDFKLVVVAEDVIKTAFDDFVILLKKFCNSRCVSELVHSQVNQDGFVTIVVNNHLPGEDGDVTEQRLSYRDGRVVRCEAVATDRSQFGAMIGRVAALPGGKGSKDDGVIAKFTHFINTFDGSPDAWTRAKPLLQDLYDADLTIATDDGIHGYGWFIDTFAMQFARDGNVAVVEEVHAIEDGLRAVIRNVVGGDDLGSTEQQGIVKNGKIVYWEAVPTDDGRFSEMIARVLPSQKDNEQIDTAEKFARYINTFDGSPDAWKRAKHLFEDLYDPDVVIAIAEGNLGYDQFVSFAENYAKERHVARVEEIERTSEGFYAKLSNTIGGRHLGVTGRRAIISDGKVVYLAALSEDEATFSGMVDLMLPSK